MEDRHPPDLPNGNHTQLTMIQAVDEVAHLQRGDRPVALGGSDRRVGRGADARDPSHAHGSRGAGGPGRPRAARTPGEACAAGSRHACSTGSRNAGTAGTGAARPPRSRKASPTGPRKAGAARARKASASGSRKTGAARTSNARSACSGEASPARAREARPACAGSPGAGQSSAARTGEACASGAWKTRATCACEARPAREARPACAPRPRETCPACPREARTAGACDARSPRTPGRTGQARAPRGARQTGAPWGSHAAVVARGAAPVVARARARRPGRRASRVEARRTSARRAAPRRGAARWPARSGMPGATGCGTRVAEGLSEAAGAAPATAGPTGRRKHEATPDAEMQGSHDDPLETDHPGGSAQRKSACRPVSASRWSVPKAGRLFTRNPFLRTRPEDHWICTHPLAEGGPRSQRHDGCAVRTLRSARADAMPASGLRQDHAHGVADGTYLVGLVVLHLDAELLLDLEDDVHETRGVDLEVAHDRGLHRDRGEGLRAFHEGLENGDDLVEDFLLIHGIPLFALPLALGQGAAAAPWRWSRIVRVGHPKEHPYLRVLDGVDGLPVDEDPRSADGHRRSRPRQPHVAPDVDLVAHDFVVRPDLPVELHLLASECAHRSRRPGGGAIEADELPHGVHAEGSRLDRIAPEVALEEPVVDAHVPLADDSPPTAGPLDGDDAVHHEQRRPRHPHELRRRILDERPVREGDEIPLRERGASEKLRIPHSVDLHTEARPRKPRADDGEQDDVARSQLFPVLREDARSARRSRVAAIDDV